MTTYVLRDDGHTVLVYRDGKLVDEEPVECHPGIKRERIRVVERAPARNLAPCPCGIARVDCEYHR